MKTKQEVKVNSNQMQGSQVVFLRAHARSGTNWLCNLLNLHPDISCKGEFHFENLFEGFKQTQNAQFGLMKQEPAMMRKQFYNMIERLVKQYCGHAPICVDRTPRSISETFIPGRKYLYISRDGRDVLVSWCYHVLRLKLYGGNWVKRNELFEKHPLYYENNKHKLLTEERFVRNIAKSWNSQIVKDVKFMKSADQGKRRFEYYWIRYEDLVQETDKYRKEIYEFMGADFKKAQPLDEITTAGFKRDQKVNTKSHYRKGKAGAWKEYFTNEQLQWFNEEAMQALKLLDLEIVTKL